MSSSDPARKNDPPVPEAIETVLDLDEVGETTGESVEELFGPDRLAGVLPLRGSVLFPRTISPIVVGRRSSVELVRAAVAGNGVLVVAMQRDPNSGEPTRGDIEDLGCVGTVTHMIESPAGTLHVLLQGGPRVRLGEAIEGKPYLQVRVEPVPLYEPRGDESLALLGTARRQVGRLVALLPELPPAVLRVTEHISQVGVLADMLASLLDLAPAQAQALLAELDGGARLRAVITELEKQLHVLELSKEIHDAARKSIDAQQTEAVLRHQLEAIQERLGERNGADEDVDELRRRLDEAHLPEGARAEVDRELTRVASMSRQSAEYSVIRTYLEWVADLPWDVQTEDHLDVAHAAAVLDEDHYGLTELKERIVEFVALRRFRPDAPSPILCFTGPPGTGKTSLGKSIARAIGRKYVRLSLGGLADEAEIRGHRRTYVGAMPGRIIAALRQAGTRNPVLVLDEIDKLGRDVRGDPYAALLEVLDPEQNSGFTDHYLGVPFDLSRVMFICTANLLDTVPPALRDRMDALHLSGYTPREKYEIAVRHLVPRLLEETGLDVEGVGLTRDAIELLIEGYTREAGVRELERRIAAVFRKIARRIGEHRNTPRLADAALVVELLEAPRHRGPDLPRLDRPGSALGLAWTPTGGEVLVIDAVALPDGEGLQLTGQLGEVMKESAAAALSYLQANAGDLSVTTRKPPRIHIHVPAGGVPKDGPSAGVAIFAALASLLTGRLPSPGVAMTGEITLRGRVLPVGGIKEKILAAHRAGVRAVILPRGNEADLRSVPADVRAAMRLILIDRADELIEEALAPAPPHRRAIG